MANSRRWCLSRCRAVITAARHLCRKLSATTTVTLPPARIPIHLPRWWDRRRRSSRVPLTPLPPPRPASAPPSAMPFRPLAASLPWPVSDLCRPGARVLAQTEPGPRELEAAEEADLPNHRQRMPEPPGHLSAAGMVWFNYRWLVVLVLGQRIFRKFYTFSFADSPSPASSQGSPSSSVLNSPNVVGSPLTFTSLHPSDSPGNSGLTLKKWLKPKLWDNGTINFVLDNSLIQNKSENLMSQCLNFYKETTRSSRIAVFSMLSTFLHAMQDSG